jgi:hypothetical protein
LLTKIDFGYAGRNMHQKNQTGQKTQMSSGGKSLSRIFDSTGNPQIQNYASSSSAVTSEFATRNSLAD